MKIFATLLAVALAVTGGLSQETQGAPPPFSVAVSAAQDGVAAGRKLNIIVKVKNLSAEPLSHFSELLKLDVRDAAGNPVPETLSHRVQREARQKSDWVPRGVSILPGETYTEYLPINEIYDMSKPGQYSVQVERYIGTSSATLKSNVIKVAVTDPALSAQFPETTNASFSLEIDTSRDDVSLGSDVNVSVYATDNTDHAIDFDNSLGMYSVEVQGPQGSSVPLTAAGQQLSRYRGKGGHHVHLQPGIRTPVGMFPVAQFYDLTEPGAYTIQLEQTDAATNTVVKSNKITVNMSRPPAP